MNAWINLIYPFLWTTFGKFRYVEFLVKDNLLGPVSSIVFKRTKVDMRSGMSLKFKELFKDMNGNFLTT